MTASIAKSSPRARHLRVQRLGLGGLAGAMTLVGMLAFAAAGPFFWTHDPNATDLLERFTGFSANHPLGTDAYGRDILARLVHGARLSLLGATAVLVGALSLGLLAGALTASIGGKIDAVSARVVDGLLSLPSLIVALGIVGVLGKSFENLLVALILTSWPWYARIYRGLVVNQRHQTYVQAATALGCSPFRVAWRHIGPNIAGPSMVVATVNLGNAILSLASLSFLGLGVTPPAAEWGSMVNDARLHFQTHPWPIVAPGLAISITVIAVNLLGDSLRDLNDPRRR